MPPLTVHLDLWPLSLPAGSRAAYSTMPIITASATIATTGIKMSASTEPDIVHHLLSVVRLPLFAMTTPEPRGSWTPARAVHKITTGGCELEPHGLAIGTAVTRQLRVLIPPMTAKVIFRALLVVVLFFCGIVSVCG